MEESAANLALVVVAVITTIRADVYRLSVAGVSSNSVVVVNVTPAFVADLIMIEAILAN